MNGFYEKMKKNKILICILITIFTINFNVVYGLTISDAESASNHFILSFKNAFNSNLNYRLEKGVGTPSLDENTILIPKMLIKHLNLNSLNFILAHESAHYLLSEQEVFWGTKIEHRLAIELPYSHVLRKDRSLFFSILDQNADTLGVKVLKYLKIPFDYNLIVFDVFMELFPSLRKFYDVFLKRKINIKEAYIEGWNNWDSFIKVWPICNKTGFLDFLFNNDFNQILQKVKGHYIYNDDYLNNIYSNVSKADCELYSFDSMLETLINF